MLSKDSHRGTLQALALGLKGRVSDCLATARRDAAPAGWLPSFCSPAAVCSLPAAACAPLPFHRCESVSCLHVGSACRPPGLMCVFPSAPLPGTMLVDAGAGQLSLEEANALRQAANLSAS